MKVVEFPKSTTPADVLAEAAKNNYSEVVIIGVRNGEHMDIVSHLDPARIAWRMRQAEYIMLTEVFDE